MEKFLNKMLLKKTKAKFIVRNAGKNLLPLCVHILRQKN